MGRITRRQFLTTAAIGAASMGSQSALIGSRALAQTTSLSGAMTQAATQFLASLDASRRARAVFAFNDTAERTRWHWTTPAGFPRNGLPLKDMTPDQRARALALLKASLSDAGYKKALEIIALQTDLGQDPELYFVSVFGTPGSNAPWGWRFEGHHYSRHFTLVGDRITVTPFFLGAWPTQATSGVRPMAREEDAARELVRSLDARRQGIAIFQRESLNRHVTWNEVRVSPLEPVGVTGNDLSAAQQRLMQELIQTYLGTLSASVGLSMLERVQRVGLDKVRFGWAGSLEPRRPQYWRLQGPTFLLEFDNSRNGGTHIHSVWRDFEADFGANLL